MNREIDFYTSLEYVYNVIWISKRFTMGTMWASLEKNALKPCTIW